MDRTQQGIIILLKSSVTENTGTLPDGFSLEEASTVIKKQGLVPLAYDGAVRCGVSREDPVMKDLFQNYYTVMLQSERQMAKVDKIFQEFEKVGIDYLPFKGCVMKWLYPKPELRVMGDADILIRLEQYERIKPILDNLGFKMETESDCELIWKNRDLYLELHKCMVQPTHRDYYDYFGDGWGRAVCLEGHCYGFSPEDMYIYLFMHFTKHYRSGGIGCRHVVDLWMFRRANPSMDQEYIDREMKVLHLERFHENCIRLLDVWFGGGQADEVTEFISRRIFSGGAWGNVMDYQIFQELRKIKEPGKIRYSRASYVMYLVFPPLRQMRGKYPVLNQWPFLLPIAWVVRGMSVLLHKREKLNAAVKTGNIISDDSLKSHLEALRMVGLEWPGQEFRKD